MSRICNSLPRQFCRILLLGSVAFFWETELLAQQFGGIRGQVVDSDFGQPIAKASVTVMDTPFGAITDEQGNFTISGVPPGVYGIQTRASGYIPRTMPEVADHRLPIERKAEA